MKRIVLMFLTFVCVIKVKSQIFSYTEKATSEFKNRLSNVTGSDQLLYGGIYTLQSYGKLTKFDSASKYSFSDFYTSPIAFFNNGLIFLDENNLQKNSYLTTAKWYNNYNKRKHVKNNWGLFYVQGNLIKAIVYVSYIGRGYTTNWHYLTYFEGNISSPYLITNWRMVPPFPKLTKLQTNFSNDLIEFLKMPKSYIFREFNEKGQIDSINVWIKNR